MENRPKGRLSRIWRPLIVLLLVLACGGLGALFVIADRPEVLAVSYLNLARDGNSWAAGLLADHFSEDNTFNSRSLALDFGRDTQMLAGAEISGVTTEQMQTLSGQWATELRFKYHPATGGPWQQAALRVKTDTWLVFTYIRAVEPIQ